MPRYGKDVLRAIFTKRILAAVAFALVFGAACVLLGQWQLSRFEDKDARATAVETNYAREPVPLVTVLPTTGAALREDQVWSKVTATGRYAATGSLLVRGRALNAAQGLEVLVPFQVDGGGVLLVDRGWVPNGETATDIPAFPPAPAGTVTITGWLKPSEEDRGRDLPVGQLATINLAQAQEQVGGSLYAAYLVLGAEILPAGGAAPDRPAALEPPSVDRGPHFAYALQWWLSALLGLAFVVFLYRGRPGAAQEREAQAQARAGAGVSVSGPKVKKSRIWDEEDG